MTTQDTDEDCTETFRPIVTRRLRLRRPERRDARAIATLAGDRHIAEMTSRIPHPYTIEDAERFLAGTAGQRVFAVVRLADDGLIGMCALHEKPAPTALELGYWLGRPFWGQGFATEAAQAIIDHAFEDLRADSVEIRCRVVNGASRRVIQKCGFQYCGTGMDVSLIAGRVASESYRMDRRCWQSLKAWGGR